MPFANDLLDQAYHLVYKDAGPPKQASLRRAVSTAYFALFHLLIDETVGMWAVERQRSILARTFDHSKMYGICDEVRRRARSGAATQPELVLVAQNFVRLQQERHTADYDNAFEWTHKYTLDTLELATDAFAAWRTVRTQDAAQDFLLDLFLPKRTR